ncbi:MAG TPA: hypothetical protein VEH79_02045 [Gaiellaceae bacterium]|nr:hypothetical protein [Gaiellaceae bacterium]
MTIPLSESVSELAVTAVRVVVVVTTFALCFSPARSAAAASRGPAPRLEGPFGEGDAEVWLLRPRGAPRSIVVFGHGWKLFPPSPSRPWVGQFRPWLDHLVERGSAVVFPRYQLGTGDDQGVDRLDAYKRGLALGLSRLGAGRLPIVAVGYSFGASLALYYAADARRWHLPEPAAVDGVFPAGLIAGAPFAGLPNRTRVVFQVGDRDAEAGAGGALAFWARLASHPAARKRYEVVRSHGGFVADHAAPKGSSSAARVAFWAPLDALVSAARGSR